MSLDTEKIENFWSIIITLINAKMDNSTTESTTKTTTTIVDGVPEVVVEEWTNTYKKTTMQVVPPKPEPVHVPEPELVHVAPPRTDVHGLTKAHYVELAKLSREDLDDFLSLSGFSGAAKSHIKTKVKMVNPDERKRVNARNNLWRLNNKKRQEIV